MVICVSGYFIGNRILAPNSFGEKYSMNIDQDKTIVLKWDIHNRGKMGYLYEIILQGFVSAYDEWKDLETLSDIGSFHSTEKHYFYTEMDNAIREPSAQLVYYFTREKMIKDFESITVDFKEKAKEILNETQSLDDYIEKLQEFKDVIYPPTWESEFMVWWRLMSDWSNFYDILRIRFAVKV